MEWQIHQFFFRGAFHKLVTLFCSQMVTRLGERRVSFEECRFDKKNVSILREPSDLFDVRVCKGAIDNVGNLTASCDFHDLLFEMAKGEERGLVGGPITPRNFDQSVVRCPARRCLLLSVSRSSSPISGRPANASSARTATRRRRGERSAREDPPKPRPTGRMCRKRRLDGGPRSHSRRHRRLSKLKLLLRASRRPEAVPLALGLDGFETPFPGIATWMQRVEQLPDYEKTYPPHWRQT
jgi:hypothetical protein